MSLRSGGSSIVRWGLRRILRTAGCCSRPLYFIKMASTASTASRDGPVRFKVQSKVSEDDARLGRLDFRQRKAIQTPHYIAISSRGTVPHITQDMMRDQTSISAMYTALEDYAERLPKSIPMLSFPCSANESPLRRFIALQGDPLLVLGPRRIPPVSATAHNNATNMNIFTSVGFYRMEITAYIDAAKRARPDIVIGAADIEFGKPKLGLNRIDKMDERTLAWVRALQTELSSHQQSTGHHLTSLWAPIPPMEAEQQRSYMEYLDEQPASAIGGIALYANDSLSIIPKHLRHLPRLIMNNPKTPHDILLSISLGADLLTAPFVNDASNAGQAFVFTFPQATSSSRLPLAIDLWSTEHASSLEPLVPSCPCYTCRNHHRAYIHHLLQAKEMLAWVLLQVHNHCVFDSFFANIRQSLAAGKFDQDMHAFGRAYADEFPTAQGEGPRIRGYQMASAGPGEPPRNKKRYGKLDNIKNQHKKQMREESVAQLEETQIADADAGLFVGSEHQGETGFDMMYRDDMSPGSDNDTEDRKP